MICGLFDLCDPGGQEVLVRGGKPQDIINQRSNHRKTVTMAAIINQSHETRLT